jgi:hypothetical protein
MLNIAIKLKDIAHIEEDAEHRRFFRASSITNLEEVIQALPEFNGFALVVEDNQEGNYLLNGSGVIFDNQMCGFFLLTKANNLDAADRGSKIRAAEAIMRKIIAKMRIDYHSDNQAKTFIGLRNIDWSTLRYFSFGPVLDNCYGVYCNFAIPDIQNTTYDATDWNQ